MTLSDAHSWLISAVRGFRGISAQGARGPAPQEPLVLYEFEACPFCRKVREVLCELDLSYLSVPCAFGSPHREELRARGGKVQLPYLIDPNTGAELYESEDIITYLLETYGAGRSALSRAAGPLNTLGATLASGLRPLGRHVRKGAASPPEGAQPLTLYSYEACNFSRRVREELNRLDLVYEVAAVPKGGRRRDELLARGGKMQVPYLVDPNAGIELFESDAIIDHLRRRYGGAPAEGGG